MVRVGQRQGLCPHDGLRVVIDRCRDSDGYASGVDSKGGSHVANHARAAPIFAIPGCSSWAPTEMSSSPPTIPGGDAVPGAADPADSAAGAEQR
jgi:hypothetical protein